MAAWFLNAALTAFRNEINKRFPKRDKQSEGTIGDTAHQATPSQHNPDGDGSVDAWDMDIDLDGKNDDKGPAREIEALKVLFQKDPRSQLWIHNGQIANRDVQNWKRRPYTGKNAHRRHVHWQSRASQERLAHSWEVDKVLDALNAPVSTGKSKIGTRTLKLGMKGLDVAFLQRWLGIDDDGIFGPATEIKVKSYQRMRGITADGVVGPATFKQMGVVK